MNGMIARYGGTAVKRALLMGVIGALLTSFIVVNTVTSSSLGTTSLSLATETFSADANLSITALGVMKVASNAGAIGNTSPGVDVTSGADTIQNGQTKNNYAYQFTVAEALVGSLTTGDEYKLEVWGDDGTTTSLLATLFFQQTTEEGAAVEDVTVIVDLASSTTIHDSFDIVATKVAP